MASPSPGGHTRKRFSLKGPSAQVDPRVNAHRRDLADVRLAERVFAPHYAAPLLRVLIKPVELRATASLDSDVLARLASNEPFEVLEFAGVHAWGISPSAGLVGYIPAEALAGSVE